MKRVYLWCWGRCLPFSRRRWPLGGLTIPSGDSL